MSGYKRYYDAVAEIYSCLKRDLVGPVEEMEVLENIEPLSTYACGILWPLRTDSLSSEADEPEEAALLAQQEDVEEVEDILVSANDSISNANIYKPTSMGISLMLPKEANELKIRITLGNKKRRDSHDRDVW